MIQLPATITANKSTADAAAKYLEKIANEQAAQGWEFYRIDRMSTRLPGAGGRQQIRRYRVVTFRYPRS